MTRVTRERQHSQGIDHAARKADPDHAGEADGWPGKQTLTSDLGSPTLGVLAAERVEPGPSLDLGQTAGQPDLGALDQRLASLHARDRARGDEDDQALWIAQQQRATRWKQVAAWARAHRARRER